MGYIVYYIRRYDVEKFFYNFSEKDSIKYIVRYGKEKNGKYFHGFFVYNNLNNIENFIDYKIIIVSNWCEYIEIKNDLEKLGLIEFQNFLFMGCYGKKIAITNTTCYKLGYDEYLRKSKSFSERFFLYPTVWVSDQKQPLSKELLDNVDLIISENYRHDNKIGEYVTISWLKDHVRDTCKFVVVPRIARLGRIYFPPELFPENGVCFFNGTNQWVIFSNSDSFIDRFYEEGFSVTEIQKKVLSTDLINDEYRDFLRNNVKKIFDKYRVLEKSCDIKYLDFIENNYKEYKLFVDYGHPTSFLINELCKRIGKYLNLYDWDKIIVEYKFQWQEQFVYPAIKETLGLTFKEDTIRQSDSFEFVRKLNYGPMSLNEYIKQYIYLKYEKYSSDESNGENIYD